MTYDIKSPRLSAKLTAAVAISALLALGTFTAMAHAGWDEHHHGYNHGYNGGYYRAPPVAYGGYYGNGYGYYPPPVVYGPSIGISLPGVNIGIR